MHRTTLTTTTVTVAVAGAVLVGLTGCVATAPSTSSSAAAPPTSASPTPTPTASAPSDGLSDGLVPPPDDPLPAGDDTTVVAFVEQAMGHFASPELTPEAWLNGMMPYLSEQGAEKFAGTDPANIPAHHVGAARLLDHPIAIMVRVAVPTDNPTGDGEYLVSVSRRSVTEPWGIDAIRQPGDWVHG